MRIQSPDVKGSLDAFLAAAKPDRLRIETLDFFGNPVTVLVADGRRFAYFDSRAGTYYRGDATPANVSKLLPVVLPADEIATILCGSAPILPGQPLATRAKAGKMLLLVAQDDLAQRLTVGELASIEESRVRRATRTATGEPLEDAPAYDLDLGPFRRFGALRFPTELTLAAPAARVRVGLRWKEDLKVNGAEDLALFVLEPPRGARVVDLAPGAEAPAADLPLVPEEEAPPAARPPRPSGE